jgi:hypothetical protein
VRHGGLQLVNDQFHPQLGHLVLHDEQHFVVVRRLAQRLLGRQQGVQPQVAAIGQSTIQVEFDTGLEVALILGHGLPCNGKASW